MNYPLVPTAMALADTLLLDIARRIQLAPSDYRLAVERYGAIDRYLTREGSPFNGLVPCMYPQGSMAIGATIASRLKNDEFDIDVVVELSIAHTTAPDVVLDALFDALNGPPGSRYHGKVHRRSRCVTLDYDRMHIDLTPAVLLPGRMERTSVIFHAHEDEPAHLHKRITANPWGLADWFERMTPAIRTFAEYVLRKAAEPVPDQEELNEKSLPLVALQLIKRWRNKCYDERSGRCPPSVVLAYYAATLQGHRTSLLPELVAQARHLLSTFADHDRRGALIEVVNPTCPEDVLSDRWPATSAQQAVFTRDLRRLVDRLAVLQESPSLEDCTEVMSGLFGENPTRATVEQFQQRYRDRAHGGGLYHQARTGALALGASGISRTAAAAAVYRTPPHSNFGSDGEP